MRGELTVAPGPVSFAFSQSAGQQLMWKMSAGEPLPPPVVHAELPVTLLRSRLGPPGMGRMLILTGEGATVVLVAWWPTFRRIHAALRSAGIEITERSALFANPIQLPMAATPTPTAELRAPASP
jgi:hypothetical protein